TVSFPRHLRVGKGTNIPSRGTDIEPTGRDLGISCDVTIGSDERPVSYHHTIHHDGTNTDEHSAADMAAVQHRAMSYVTVGCDHGLPARETVQHATILHISPGSDVDPAHIPA